MGMDKTERVLYLFADWLLGKAQDLDMRLGDMVYMSLKYRVLLKVDDAMYWVAAFLRERFNLWDVFSD